MLNFEVDLRMVIKLKVVSDIHRVSTKPVVKMERSVWHLAHEENNYVAKIFSTILLSNVLLSFYVPLGQSGLSMGIRPFLLYLYYWSYGPRAVPLMDKFDGQNGTYFDESEILLQMIPGHE